MSNDYLISTDGENWKGANGSDSMEDAISLTCPNCGRRDIFIERYSSYKESCPKCGRIFTQAQGGANKIKPMISANELRIGNWVELLGKPVTVKEITNLTVEVSETRGATYRSIDPIPLKSEILEKAGFAGQFGQLTNHSNNLHGGVTIEYDAGNYYFTGGEGINLSIAIKYVHQLQNLYFALTGTELIIEL